jgi:menaquinol-cytochrome c reductase iron-sulfur subunit
MTPPAPFTRRRFHVASIYALWATIAAALGLPAACYLLLPPRLRKRQEWVEAGTLAQVTDGAPFELVFRRNRVDGWKITSEKTTAWVVKQADGTVAAFAPQCTHLGCAYHWDEQRKNFLCPCHTSMFGLDGRVLSGPAPRPLDRYETKVEGGKLLLGPIKRSDGGRA